MSFLDTGCQCEGCLKSTKDDLLMARTLWKMGERKIEFPDPENFDDIFYPFIINGFEVNLDATNVRHVLKDLFEFLEIDNVRFQV